MKILNLSELEKISAQGKKEFCQAFYVGESVYAIGALANWWNPPGWAATVALIGVNGNCAFG